MPEAVQNVIISLDVSSSGDLENDAKVRMREIVYDVVDRAFAAARISSLLHARYDRGDGVLITVDPVVSGTRLAGLWLQEAYWALREYNEPLRRPIRMRVALHIGAVQDDGRGPFGRAVDLTCRLGTSHGLRSLLVEDASANLAVVVSPEFHESAVRGGGLRVEREKFIRATVLVDDEPTPVWFFVPGRTAPATDTSEPEPRPEPASRRPVRPARQADPSVSAGRDVFFASDAGTINQGNSYGGER